MTARGLIEIAKATGRVDIVPGFKLFIREFFQKGQVVDLDSNHRIRVAKDGAFTHPFIFVASSELSRGNPDIAECESEEKAIITIEAILEQEE